MIIKFLVYLLCFNVNNTPEHVMCPEILLVGLEFSKVNRYLLTYRKVEAFNNPNCLTEKQNMFLFLYNNVH
jgi:hypothetical protein